MRIIYSMALLIVFQLVLFAQEESKDASVNSKQAEYSESLTYKPREVSKTPTKPQKSADQGNHKNNIATQIFELPVYVFDEKVNPVKSLPKEAFSLFVDGKEKEIQSVEVKEVPLNVIFLVDTSASASSLNLKKIQTLVSEMVSLFLANSSTKVGIIAFNENQKILCTPTSDRETLLKAVKKIKEGGGTSLYDTVKSIIKDFGPSASERTVVMLLTDGVDTTSQKSDFQKSLAEAESSNLVFFPLFINTYEPIPKNNSSNPNGMRSGIIGKILSRANMSINTAPKDLKAAYELGLNYLLDIALLSGGRTFEIKHIDKFAPADYDYVTNAIRPHYSVSFNIDSDTGTNHRQEIKIRINRPNLKIHTKASRIVQN